VQEEIGTFIVRHPTICRIRILSIIEVDDQFLVFGSVFEEREGIQQSFASDYIG
jgi:hypothetical protein